MTERNRQAQLVALEERIGHRFADRALFAQALTHASRANEDLSGALRDNEPLEFLGDSVLGFLVSVLLHEQDPDGDEGAKTRTRAHLVSSGSLSRRAKRLGLPALIVLGRGEEKTGGRAKHSLWADAFEALVAALYLDGGLEAARRFVIDQFAEELAAGSKLDQRDHKSALQELLQGRGDVPPDYEVVDEEGPAHRRRYRVVCRIAGDAVGEGTGYSKKEAQQEAARQALAVLDRSPPPGDSRAAQP